MAEKAEGAVRKWGPGDPRQCWWKCELGSRRGCYRRVGAAGTPVGSVA